MENRTQKTTDARRTAWNEYQKRYRAKHPDAVRRWRRTYILRAAARMAAESTEQAGGVRCGGD